MVLSSLVVTSLPCLVRMACTTPGRRCRRSPAGCAVWHLLPQGGRRAKLSAARPKEGTACRSRQTSRHLEEDVFAADIDPGVDETVARAAAAQAVLATWTEDRVEALLTAVAEAVAGRAGELAAATVAETEIASPVGVVLGLIP
jgi:hypothetical protein